MMHRRTSGPRAHPVVIGTLALLPVLFAPLCSAAQPTPATTSSFNSYIAKVEARLAQQHQSQNGFLASGTARGQNEARLRGGELIIEQLTPAKDAEWPGAMLHDWRGTAFAPGAKAADFERLMKDFGAYPRYFAPQVTQAKILSHQPSGLSSNQNSLQGDRFQAVMRVRQKHVITVVMDTAYDITFSRLDPQHGYSISRSTEIDEIDSPGTRNERTLKSSEEHGFLWRLNTYWSYEERDGGLYMQIESVSLTRSIPTGLGWIIGPFVKSVPRESLEFTLRATCNALQKKH